MTENRFIYNKFNIVGDFEKNELKLYEIDNNPLNDLDESNLFYVYSDSEANIENIVDKLNTLTDENEQLKKEKENWKHKVGQLLFILSQFDEEKVKRLMEDLEND